MRSKSPILLIIICLAALFAFTGVAAIEHTPDASAEPMVLDSTMVTLTGSQITGFTAAAAAVYHDIVIPRVIGTTTITGIGASAFMNTGLTSVTFASDSAVTVINGSAFRNNNQLTTIILPDTLETVGTYAFASCPGLVTIYPAGTSDTSINSLPAGMKSLGGSTFEACTSLASIDMSGCTNLKTIPTYCFYNCSHLTEVILPDGLETIGRNALANVALTAITLPEGLKTIDTYAFYNCASLNGIHIPASVTAIGTNAFYGFPTNEVIDLTDHAPGSIANAPWGAGYAIIQWAEDPSVDSVCYPLIFNKDTGIICGVQASASTADIKNITIPDSFTIGGIVYPVKGLSDGAFGSRPANTNILTVTINSNPEFTSISDNAFYSCTKLTTITIPETVTSIGSNAFRSCTSLKTITLPDGLERIASQAFQSSGLTAVTIPGGVSVEDQAFYNCLSLKTITISEGVTFGAQVFVSTDANSLERVDFLGTWSVNSIPTDIFSPAQTKLTNIYIESMPKDSVSGAPWSATYANIHWADGITAAQIATGIDEYGNTWQFNPQTGTIIKYLGTTNNTVDLIVPNTLYLYIEAEGEPTFIGTDPFAITTVGDGNTVSIINAPKQLKSVTISDGITAIGDYAFDGVTIGTGDPNALKLGNDVATIGICSFRNCGLTFVVLPESIKTLDNFAFASNAIDTNNANGPLVIPGSMTSVKINSFSGNPNITQINIMQNRNSSSAGNGYVTSPTDVRNLVPFGAVNVIATVYADDPKPIFDPTKFSIVGDPSTNTVTITIYTKMSDSTTLTAIIGHALNKGNPIVTPNIATSGNDWSSATMVVKNTDGADGNGNGLYTFIVTYGPTGATANLYYEIPSPVELFHAVTYVDTEAPNLTTTGALPSTVTYVSGYNVTMPVNTMSKTYTGDDLAEAVFIGWGTAQQTSLIVLPADYTAYTATNSIYTAGSAFTMPNQDTTLYGIWASDIDGDGTADYLEGPYTLTYNVNGGNSDGPANVTDLSVQRAYTLSTTGPTHADGTVGGEVVKVVFIGWTATADPNIYAAGDTAPVTITSVNIYDNVIVYAVWGYDANDDNIPDVFEHTLHYDANGGDQTSCPADAEYLVPYTYDLDTATVPTHADDNGKTVSFAGWSLDIVADILSKGDTVPTMVTSVTIMDSDVTVYAVWTYYVEPVIPFTKTYRITASSDTGSEISPSGTVFVKGGSDMTFAYSAKDGYYISKVYVDGVSISEDKVATGSYTFADVRSNHTIRVESVANAADDGRSDDHGEKDGADKNSGTNTDSNDKGWGVLNLICAILAIFTGILIVVLGRDRFKDNGEKRSRTAMFLSVIALILGIVSVIVFFLTEDLSLPAIATDVWTPLMFVLLVIVLIISFISHRFDGSRS